MDTADEDDPVVTTKWNEASDVVDEAEGNFSRFRISEELQTKLRGLQQSLSCFVTVYIVILFIYRKSNTSIYSFREVWLTHCRPRHTNADTHMKGCYNNLIFHVISFLTEMHEMESAFVAVMQTYPSVLNAII